MNSLATQSRKRKGNPRASSKPGRPRRKEFYFDKAAAERAVKFFEQVLTHCKGEWAGKPLILERWQKDKILRPVFGWKRRSDGTRRYRSVYIEVPRKNSKSTMGAGIAIILLLIDDEPGAEVYSCAADRDQAALVFDVARQMVDQSPMLAKRCKIYRRSIVAPETASAYHVLSADAPTKHGKNASGIIFDELHAQPNRELWDVMSTATGSRRQPLRVALTTAGYDKHSICYEVHDYAIKVRDGIIQDDSFLPVIYAADEGDDWKSEATWKKANPNYGVSIKTEYLRQECLRAQETPAYENTFKRLHLNIWTEQAVRAIPMDQWNLCAEPRFTAEDLEGEPCVGGLDLATTTDIAAFSLIFPPRAERTLWAWLAWFWVPHENIRRRALRDRVPYDLWAREGFIKPTEGNVIDYDVIRTDINELFKRFPIAEIAVDRWNATQLITQLSGDGLTMVPFGQGFKDMTAPTKELLKLVAGKQFTHSGNPVLTWMAGNFATSQDPAGNLKPDKARSTERIDGIVSGAMAIGRAMLVAESKFAHEDGILFL